MFGLLRNLKWSLMLTFIVTLSISSGLVLFGWIYYVEMLNHSEFWLMFIGIVIGIGLIAGYWSGHRIQRKIDNLHVNIIQITKGNLSVRIDEESGESFPRLAHDFNEMAESLENRIKLLQQLGEERGKIETETIEAAVIEERKRLARDLHDSVSQQLFAIHLSASTLPAILAQDKEKGQVVMEQLIQMSYVAQKQMRGLIAQLRPIELQGKSLKEALERWFPEYCGQHNLQGTLEIKVKDAISEGIEQQLFLMAQEGLANVVKHASATEVTLSLIDQGHQYLLLINDNGVGFDKTMVKNDSYGLMTMRERANKLGGSLEVFSKPGRGTRLRIRIPKFN